MATVSFDSPLRSRFARLGHAAVVVGLIGAAAPAIHGGNSVHRAHMSADIALHHAKKTNGRVRVIVRSSDADLDGLAARHHLQRLRGLRRAAVVLANSDELDELASDPLVASLSGDLPVATATSLENVSTGADQARAGSPATLTAAAIPAVDGHGIGVAVIDSGIAPHSALAQRVVAEVSFVSGDSGVTDAYGHGTHVAGIIAGSPVPAGNVTSLYAGGIAPGANLINVRVLGADGSGYTSDVIAGIDWVIANRSTYNIRVINLSVGHPVTEGCSSDPLCDEVNRAVNAGIVVVIAAGNYGKASDGSPVLGSIASPGNSPYAITVGALNTAGTVGRADDQVATFSSRGPTAFDLAVKPDVVAPGMRIVSLQASGSALPAKFPSIQVAGSLNNAYMYLSGTSMAAPIVSGGVALLLQGAPQLTPAQVKLALQSGAGFVDDGGLMSAGAGSVNFWASRQLIANQLTAPVSTMIAGEPLTTSGASFWDAGTLANRLSSGLGMRLLSATDATAAFANPSNLNFGDFNLLGLANPLATKVAKSLLYGAVATWTCDQTITWGTSVQNPQGATILWGTSVDETILWGTADDTILWGTSDDTILWGTSSTTTVDGTVTGCTTTP